MFYVYALQGIIDKNWLYIGYSDNLRQRFHTHNAGRVKSTKSKKPLRLVYYEAYTAEKDARKREYQLKTSSKEKEILKKMLGFSLM